MQSFTTTKVAKVLDFNGQVVVDSEQNQSLSVDLTLEPGAVLSLPVGAEVTLAFEDGSLQKVTAVDSDAENNLIVETLPNNIAFASLDNIQDDIEAIQALIQSGDDLDLPDTAAGGIQGNQGTDFVTLDRDGDELLASAGYDTTGVNTATTENDDPELAQRSAQPTITQSDFNTIAEDTIASGNVLDNDSDLDDALTVQSFTVAGDATVYTAGQTVAVEGGTIVLNTDGSYTFTPNENFNGLVPVVTYTTNTGASDTLSIEVTPVSDLTDDNESVSSAEDTTINGNVLSNSSSADGSPLVVNFTVDGTTYSVGETAALTEGSLTINQDGSYTFLPSANFNGTVPVTTYTVSDGENTDTSTLTINITPVSDLSDDDEVVTTSEDTTVTGNVLTNASSADGTPAVTGFTVSGTTYSVGDTASITEGNLTINSDGSYTFVPAANFNGIVPEATYTVEDGINTEISTLSIEVTPESDLTDADESVSTAEDTSVNGNLLTNASSADGTLAVTGFTVSGTTYSVGNTASLTEGNLTINADGSYSFVPADNFNGTVPVATYTVEDGVNSDSSTLSIEVTPASALTDADESVSTAEDTTVNGNVLTNAASADGTPVVSGFTVGGTTYSIGSTANLTEGDLTINANGSYSFVPAANYNGAVPVATYTVEDGVNSDSSTLSIEVTPASDLTDADESVSTAEDTNVSGNVLNNAASADGTPTVTGFTVGGTTYSIGSTANLTEGDLTIKADGSYTFAPAANYNGAVPVATYTVEDGVNSDNSTLSINVTPVSDLTDGNESVTTAEDTNVSGNVLSNASSADGTPTVTGFTVGGTTYPVGSTANLTEGSLTINQDGSYTFLPSANFNGTVPVTTYTVSDGENTDTSTLTINITPVSGLSDDDEVVTTSEDTTVTGNVLTNASSADGTPAVTGFTVSGTTYSVGDTASITEGNLTINSDGSYTFVPAANFNGIVPEATYTVEDGINTEISTLSIEVTPESDLTDADESVSTAEDTSVTGNVLTNASSADGTPTVTDFTVSGTTYSVGDTASLTEGNLTINADGSYSFVPADNFNGTVPVATYTVEDGVNSDSSTLSIEVTPASDLTDADESVSTAEDTTVNGNVLTNAASADGTPVVSGFTVGGTTYSIGSTANLTEGDLTINANGSYSFVPAANYNGAVPVATYTLEDGVNSDSSTLSIEVTPASDLTDANESVSTAEDTTVNGNVLTNAASADGTPTVTGFTVGGTTYPVGSTANLTEGDLTINANGTYTFAPAANYNGAVPVATYTVEDGVNTDTSTLTIAVTPVSDLTDADESVSTAEDTNVSGNVLNNAASADGTPTVTGFTVGGTTYSIGSTANLTEGDLTINANGSYTFAPAANYNGAVPVATYTVEDGVNTDTSTLTIAVTQVSDLTDADESVSTAEDTNVSGNILNNAASADGTPTVTGFTVGGTTYSIGSTANLTEGDLTINADGSYTFAPAANYNGAVSVATYTVEDGVNSDNSTLSINVTPVSDLTDANESVTTAEDTNVSGNVLSNASSADGTPTVTGFTVGGTTYPVGSTANLTEGDLTINANGSYSFVPAANFNGTVPVATYSVEDGVNTDTSTLSIVVTAVNNPPVAEDDNFTVNEGQSVSGNVISHDDGDGIKDTDGGDGAVLTVTQVNGADLVFDPVTGEARVDIKDGFILIKADGSFTYTHDGSDPVGVAPSFNYTLSDGTDVDTGAVTIAVKAVNDPPVAADDSYEVDDGKAVTGNVITNPGGLDSDGGDGADLSVTGIKIGSTTYSISSGQTITVPLGNGSLTIDWKGEFSYKNEGFVVADVMPTFDYTLSDGTDTDTATVTIEVNDDGPNAQSDNNYIELKNISGTQYYGSFVEGNVIEPSSSGDRPDKEDSDDAGKPTLTQVVYDDNDPSTSNVYTFLNDDPITIKTAYGDLTIYKNGHYEFSMGRSVDLKDGDIGLKFTYTIQDGDTINPETDSADLTIYIGGKDHNAPVITGTSTGEVAEDAIFNASGTLEATDADASDTPTFTEQNNVGGTYGTFSIDSVGDWVYNLDNDAAQSLAGGETYTEQFTVTATTEDGESVSHVVTITVKGEDEATPTKSGKVAPAPSVQMLDFDLDNSSGTIDTDLATTANAEPDDSAFVYATDKDGDGLNDILIDSNTEGLESYLAVLGADQNAGLSKNDKEQPVNDKVTLEKNQDDSAQLLSTKVTNSLLADGAIIVSDTVANPSSASIAELDSPELL